MNSIELKTNCVITNLSTFSNLPNEIAMIRYQDGEVVAILNVLCRYSGKLVEQFKNADKAQFKQ